MEKLPSGLSGMGLIRAHRGMAGAIAAHLGITASAVSRWDIIPAERVGPVSDYTGWPRSRLRPDLWPPATQKRKAKRKAKAANGRAK